MESTTSQNDDRQGYVYSRFKTPGTGFNILKSLRRAQKTASATIPHGDVTFLCQDGKVVANSGILGVACSMLKETFASLSPFEREKIVISIPDYGTEVIAQAATVVYGGEVKFDNLHQQNLVAEALYELGFPEEFLVFDQPSGKDPNVYIKRFLEDRGTGTEGGSVQEPSTPVAEPAPDNPADVEDQKSQNLEVPDIDEYDYLIEADEVISLDGIDTDEEAALMKVSKEEARVIRRRRQAENRDNAANDMEVDDEQLEEIDDEQLGENDDEQLEEALQRRAPPGSRKRGSQTEPEAETIKKLKTNGSKRSSRINDRKKTNVAQNLRRSTRTRSMSKDDVPTTDENTAPAPVRSSSRNKQGVSSKASNEALQNVLPSKKRSTTVEPSPMTPTNQINDSNNNGTDALISVDVDPAEIITLKHLEVAVGDQSRSADGKSSSSENVGKQVPKSKRTSKKSVVTDETSKKEKNKSKAVSDSGKQTNGDQPKNKSKAVSDSGKQTNGDQPGVNHNSAEGTSGISVRQNQDKQDAAQATSNIIASTLNPELAAGGASAISEINSEDGIIEQPVTSSSSSEREVNSVDPGNSMSTKSSAQSIEPLPECDSTVEYPAGTEELDTFTRWKQTIEYCSICKTQHKTYQKAAKCLLKHGRRRCWICLKVMSSSIYDKHGVEEHGNLRGKPENFVKCPQCDTFLPFAGMQTHIGTHSLKVRTKVEALELNDAADVEQSATAAKIRIKSSSELFEDDADDEPEDVNVTTVQGAAPSGNCIASLPTSTSMVQPHPNESADNRQHSSGAMNYPNSTASNMRSQGFVQTPPISKSMQASGALPSYWSAADAASAQANSTSSASNFVSHHGTATRTTLSSSGLSGNTVRLNQGYSVGNQQSGSSGQNPSSRVVLKSGTTPSTQQSVTSHAQRMMTNQQHPQSTFSQLNTGSRSNVNQQSTHGYGRQQQAPNMYQQNQYVLSSTSTASLRPAQVNPNTSNFNSTITPPPYQANQAAPRTSMQGTVQRTPSHTQMGPPQSLMGTSVGARHPVQRPTAPAPQPFPPTQISCEGVTFTAVPADDSDDDAETGDDSPSSQASSLAAATPTLEALLELEEYLVRNDSSSINDQPAVPNNPAPTSDPMEIDEDPNFGYDKNTNTYFCRKCLMKYQTLQSADEDHICLEMDDD